MLACCCELARTHCPLCCLLTTAGLTEESFEDEVVNVRALVERPAEAMHADAILGFKLEQNPNRSAIRQQQVEVGTANEQTILRQWRLSLSFSALCKQCCNAGESAVEVMRIAC